MGNDQVLDTGLKCLANRHIVFLGDYVDRGSYNIQVLTILTLFRLINPGNVHLIRGNHEYSEFSLKNANQYSSADSFTQLLRNPILEKFYETMPLSIFAFHERKCVIFVHAFPSLTHTGLISDLEKNPHLKYHPIKTDPMNRTDQTFNWTDIRSTADLSEITRPWITPMQAVAHLHSLSTNTEVVKVYRGHEHSPSEVSYRDKVFILTLPVVTGKEGGENYFRSLPKFQTLPLPYVGLRITVKWHELTQCLCMHENSSLTFLNETPITGSVAQFFDPNIFTQLTATEPQKVEIKFNIHKKPQPQKKAPCVVL